VLAGQRSQSRLCAPLCSSGCAHRAHKTCPSGACAAGGAVLCGWCAPIRIVLRHAQPPADPFASAAARQANNCACGDCSRRGKTAGKRCGNEIGNPRDQPVHVMAAGRGQVVAVISIGRLGGGRTAADYYLQRDAGCEAEYYTGRPERPGRWLGPAARTLGLDGSLDPAGQAALRALLAGRHPDGRVLSGPVLRPDPRGRLAVGPLAAAVQAAASVREMSPAPLADPALAAQLEDLAGGRTTAASVVGQIAASAGLDPAVLYPAGDPGGRHVGYTAAVGFEKTPVDVRRSGWDVTVSAPKSVSVLWAADPDSPAARQIEQAHQASVSAVLDYLQAEAGHGLRGHQGDGQRAARIGTDGLIVAAFEHHTSRAGDPQIHTHLVMPNLLHGADDKWSAIDSRALFRHALTASHVYHVVLRSELTRRLGLEWGPVVRGIAELSAVPAPVRRAFSARRRQIENELELTGRSGPGAAQHACLTTRPAKTAANQDTPDLRQRWTARLRELGHEPVLLLHRALGRAAPRLPADPRLVTERLLADTGLTEKRSSFDRRQVLQGICQQLPAGTPITLTGLQQLTGQVLSDPAVVRLQPGDDGPAFSTRSLIDTEQHALAVAATRENAGVAVVSTAPVAGAITGLALARPALLWPQAQALLELIRSGRGVEVLVGAAGSGKTATLAAARIAWAAGGHEVFGAALAASAARNLESATGIESTSLARLLGRLDQAAASGQPPLPPRSVVVIDEAGMVGTRELHRLIAHTAAAHAKLVLVGDPHQLPEINAGGLFGALAERLPAIRLTDNQRQREQWERDALDQLRAGLTGPALTAYAAHDRIRTAADPVALAEQVAVDYLQHRKTVRSPFDVVIVTARRVDARRANDTVRDALRARGQLPDEISLAGPDGTSRSVAVGDLVMVTKNDHSRDVLNGTRATVTAHHPASAGPRHDRDRAGELLLQTTDGRQVRVPAGWLLDGRLEHAYAMTCHKAQGLTAEHTLVYGTAALTRQSGYVALSRGRSSNRLYTALDAATATAELEHPRPGRAPARTVGLDDPTLLADLDRALGRDHRQHLASPRLPAQPHPGAPNIDWSRPRTRPERRGLEVSLWHSHSRDDGHGLSR
jgi:conjugative relaxase-like TrwC/TraI family protein